MSKLPGSSRTEDTNFLLASGEMGNHMLSLDWSKTRLGPLEQWPQSLRTAVSICLNATMPLSIIWGKDLVQLYNDAYIPIAIGRHPDILGQTVPENWPDTWEGIRAYFDKAFEGQPSYVENALLVTYRKGAYEECYYTMSFSPIRDEYGEVGGVFHAILETSVEVVNERRLQTTRKLAASLAGARSVEQVLHTGAEVFSDNIYDVPFSLFYRVTDDPHTLQLVALSGLEPGTSCSPLQVKINTEGENSSGFPFHQVMAGGKKHLMSQLEQEAGYIEAKPWGVATEKALMIPLSLPGKSRPEAVFVAGLSPRLLANDSYLNFLEQMAAQMAGTIANVQALEEERKRASALAAIDQAKTTFFSNVSHEFRTPLTLMLSPLDDILRADSSDKIMIDREVVALAYRNGLRLQRLVNTLLDFSRMEAGRLNASFEAADLVQFTRNLASNFLPVTEKAGLALVFETAVEEERVYIDRHMWEKIIFNLLSNAFKFTFRGEIRVSMASGPTHVHVNISDTGIGIRETDLSRIFERFHTVEGAQSRTFEGSGIGLALVKDLVEMHGGEISVESRLGKGTTFSVAIPKGTSHLPPEKIKPESGEIIHAVHARTFVEEALRWLPPTGVTEEASATKGSDYRPFVLLVDDNRDMRTYVMELLQNHFEVVAVENGRHALDVIQERHPDIIVTDVMMPVLDGFGLLKAIKDNRDTAHIPVVMLSARAGEEAVTEGIQYGADDYLVKPFTSLELIARVEARLAISRARLLAEKEALSEKKRLAALFQQVPAAIALLEGDEFVYTLANPLYQQMVGRSENQLLGRKVREVFPELQEQGIFEMLSEVLTSGESYAASDYPVTFMKPGATVPEEHHFNFVAQPIRNNFQEVEFILIHAVEVTEQVKLRKEIRESEAYFRMMANNVPVKIWVTQADGSCIYLNSQWYEYTGQTEETGLGFGWLNAVHPEDAEASGKIFLKANAEHKAFGINYRLRDKQGQYRWAIDSALPRFDQHGVFQGFVGAVVDIHDRVKAEEELRQSRERLQLSVRAGKIGIWDWDVVNNRATYSEELHHIFGVESGIFVDFSNAYENYMQVIHPDDRVLVDREVSTVLSRGEKDFFVEFRIIQQRSGEVRWVEERGEAFYDESGKPLRMTGTIIDITHTKNIEQFLKNKNEQLEKINADLDNFIYTASHDLKAPISNIEGLANMLSADSGLMNDKSHRILSLIHQSIGRFKTTLQDLTDIARIQSEAEAEKERIAFKDVAEDVKLNIKDLIDENQAIIREDYTRAPEILFLRKNLRSIFYNLLSNAIKYRSPHRRPLVQITAEEKENFVVLSFQDNGLGIREEDKQKVFTMFKRLHDHVEGTGVGMAIVKRIVDNNGGKILIESQENVGSVFRLHLKKESAGI